MFQSSSKKNGFRSSIETGSQSGGEAEVCDCGSPNCNSISCIRPEPEFSARKPARYDENTSLLTGVLVTLAEEEGDEDEEDREEVIQDLPLDIEEKISAEKHLQEQYDYIPVKESPSTFPQKRFEDVDLNENWNNGCLCSFRDSNDRLLQRYIDKFNETIHYTKHLQKLNQNVCECKTQNRSTNMDSVLYYSPMEKEICRRLNKNDNSSRSEKAQQVSTRTPAIQRRIDKDPLEFLNKNVENICKIAKKVAPKNKEGCIIIECPVSDSEDDDNDEDVTNDNKKSRKLDSVAIGKLKFEKCHAFDKYRSKHPENDQQYSSNMRRTRYSDDSDSDPETPMTPSRHQSPYSSASSRSRSSHRSPRRKKIKVRQQIGTSTVSFKARRADRTSKKKRLKDTQTNTGHDISTRRKTPYLRNPMEPNGVTKGTQSERSQRSQCDVCSSDDESSRNLNSSDRGESPRKKRTEKHSISEHCACLEDYSTPGKKQGNSTTLSFPSKRKKKRVISIRICGGCKYSTPTTAHRVNATHTKSLNEKSKQLSQQSKVPNKLNETTRCSISKLCLRKLMQDQPKCKSKEFQDQAKEVKSKSSQFPFAIRFQKDFSDACNSFKKADCKNCCGLSSMNFSDGNSKFKNIKTSSVDQCTCTCLKLGNTSSNKQVTCQPKQSDNFTNTNPNKFHNNYDCDLCCKNAPTNNKMNQHMNLHKPFANDWNEDSFAGCTCCMQNDLGIPGISGINNGSHLTSSNWVLCHHKPFKYPYSERCQGPRYCMQLSNQTPNQSFYPNTAVQVDSMELLGNNPKRGNIKPIKHTPLKESKDSNSLIRRKKQRADSRRIKSPEINSMTPMITEEPSVQVGSHHYNSRYSEDSKSPKPDSNITTVESSKKNSVESDIEEEAKDELQVNPETTRVTLVGSGPKIPIRSSEATSKARESKRVSMKYDFPLYNAEEFAEAEIKPSATDSIEDRIRILRQNLEQRHDFGGSGTSNRSQGNLQPARMSIQDEIEISNSISPHRNKFNTAIKRKV